MLTLNWEDMAAALISTSSHNQASQQAGIGSSLENDAAYTSHNQASQQMGIGLFLKNNAACNNYSDWLNFFVHSKFIVGFHFSILWHFHLCFTGVHQVLLIGYDTTKVAPYIWKCLIGGFFQQWANFRVCALYLEVPCSLETWAGLA